MNASCASELGCFIVKPVIEGARNVRTNKASIENINRKMSMFGRRLTRYFLFFDLMSLKV